MPSQGRHWKSTFVISGAKTCSVYTPLGLGRLLTFLCIFSSDSFSVNDLLAQARSALPEIEWGDVNGKGAPPAEVVGRYNSFPLVRIASDSARGMVSLYVFEQ